MAARNEQRKKIQLLIAFQHPARHRATRSHGDRFLDRSVTDDEKRGLHSDIKNAGSSK